MDGIRFAIGVLSLAGWAHAQGIERVTPIDAGLSCIQIHEESSALTRLAQEARGLEEREKSSETKAGVANAAAAVAGRTGLFGQIGGLAGALFGQSATQALASTSQQQSSQAAQQAAERARQAEARKEYLGKLFAAKGCDTANLQLPGKPLDAEALNQLAGAVRTGVAPSDAPPPVPSDLAALRALVDRAAEPARRGMPEVKLSPSGGSRLATVVVKAPKVVVAGYRVAFVDKTGTAASSTGSRSTSYNVTGTVRTITSTHGQSKSLELQLDNVSTGLMQTLTERLYADFVAQLKAQGLEVMDRKMLSGSSHFGKLEFAKPTQGGQYVVSPTGDPRNFIVTAPAEQPIFFLAGEPLGDRGLMDLAQMKSLMFSALDVQAVPLIAQVTIDFATTETSGRGRLVNRAEVDGTPVISVTTSVSAFHSTNTVMGEWGSANLAKALFVEGEYATVKRVNEPNNTHEVANALTGLLAAATGTAGTMRSAEKRLFVADPARYSELALRAGFAANKGMAEATR